MPMHRSLSWSSAIFGSECPTVLRVIISAPEGIPVPSYDAATLQEFADKLYKQAANIVLQSVVQGILGEFFFGLAIGIGGALVLRFAFNDAEGAASFAPVAGLVSVVAGPILGGLSGWQIGREKSFDLRLKAQQALCQLQIEKNTRSR
jgi:hypothetical protein